MLLRRQRESALLWLSFALPYLLLLLSLPTHFMRNLIPFRVLLSGIVSVGLLIVWALPVPSAEREDLSPEQKQQIADIERQIKELTQKLEELKRSPVSTPSTTR